MSQSGTVAAFTVEFVYTGGCGSSRMFTGVVLPGWADLVRACRMEGSETADSSTRFRRVPRLEAARNDNCLGALHRSSGAKNGVSG